MKELSSMQRACWFTRLEQDEQQASDHLYLEFDLESVDIGVLSHSIDMIFREHSVTRMGIDDHGKIWISPVSQIHKLEIEDITLKSCAEQFKFLETKRHQWSHQKLDVKHSQVIRFSITVLKNMSVTEASGRLHIDVDLIALDPSSVRVMIHILAHHYALLKKGLSNSQEELLKINKAQNLSSSTNKPEIDRSANWWKEYMEYLFPVPNLPYHVGKQAVRSQRIEEVVPQSIAIKFRQIAKMNKLTATELMLALFSIVLSNMTGQRQFRLSVPLFPHQKDIPIINRKLGEQANFTLLNVDLTKTEASLLDWCSDIAYQLRRLLNYSDYSGVDILRELSKVRQDVQIAPVVFTSAIDLPEKQLFEEYVSKNLGELVWTISQSAHTVIDLQVCQISEGFLFNMDVREDLVSVSWAQEVLSCLLSAVRELVNNEAILSRSLQDFCIKDSLYSKKILIPMTELQKSYLVGRMTLFPLSNAMQACHAFIGSLSPSLIRSNLISLVETHQALRTYVDVDSQTQQVSQISSLNYSEHDFSNLNEHEAKLKIVLAWERWLCSAAQLSGPLWEVVMYRMPNHKTAVFTRFDGILFDGRSIAKIISQLFGAVEIIEEQQVETVHKICSSDEDMARQYWILKLKTFPSLDALPWLQKLNTVQQASYAREILIIPAKTVDRVCHQGAKQGLLRNTVLTGAIAQALTEWSSSGIYFALPVLPVYEGTISNRSTFIAVQYETGNNLILECYQKLQTDVLKGLQHLSCSGVSLSRLLCDYMNTNIPFPIVITNTLSWPVIETINGMRKVNESVQTPQVAIDIRFGLNEQRDLVLAIDFIKEAITTEQIEIILKAINDNLLKLISESDIGNINERTREVCMKKLNSLYVKVMDYPPDHEFAFSDNLFAMGLTLRHLRELIILFNDQLGLEVGIGQLVECKNLVDVERLLTHVKYQGS